ncbi:hypothetical protein HPB50_018698 [Hyalomma asiaticum]|uniref:Uncharacterized protein n=1 Tax=Hyalomma asiaticum TaxID=266040 RepID=A0ACB7RVF3_HYAAI|nr:hypothetical protein HPB50_018698 [Hyalomma asiaticum]
MQTRLLELPDPLLDDVLKVALAVDAAAEDASGIARLTGPPSAEAAVNKVTTKGGNWSYCSDARSASQCHFSPKHSALRAEKLGTLYGMLRAEDKQRTAAAWLKPRFHASLWSWQPSQGYAA